MKKILAISLLLIMTALSLNAGIAVHYCDGDLAQLKAVMGHGKATCGMEPVEKRDRNRQEIDAVPCCQDELRLIQVDDNQSSYRFSEPTQRLPIFETETTECSGLHAEHSGRRSARLYRPPPDLNGVSLPFLQVFLI